MQTFSGKRAPPMNTRFFALRRLPIAFAAILASHSVVHAQTWDGGGANDNVTTANNWNPNAVPVNDGTADLIFGGVVRLTPIFDTDFKVDSITFDNTAGAFNIGASGGSSLLVGPGGITNNDASTQTFSAPVDLSNSAVTAASGVLDFTGPISLGGTVTFAGGFTTNVDEVNGSGTLIKNGTATLNVNSSGTKNWDLVVNDGTVDFDSTFGFSSVSSIAVNGGTLDLFNTTLDGATLTRSATGNLTGTGTFSAINGATIAITGAYTPTQNVNLNGTGTTYSSGAVQVNGSRTFSIISGAAATVTGDFDIATGGTAGTLNVSGIGSSLTVAGASHDLGESASATVTVTDGATVEFTNDTVRLANGAAASANVLISGGAQMTAGTFELSPFSTSGASTVTVTGVGSKLITTFNISDFEIGDAAGVNPAVVNVDNGGELDLNGPLTIHQNGTLNLNGGLLTLQLSRTLTNNGTLNFITGRIILGEALGVAGPGNNLFGANLVLTPGQEILLRSSLPTTVGAGGALVIDGGTLVTGSLVNDGGTIDLRRGKLQVNTATSIGTTGPLGANAVVPAAATLQLVTATIDSDASLFVDGGTYSGATLANDGSIRIENGVMDLLSSLTNNAGASVTIDGGSLDTATVTNNGITTISAGFVNVPTFNNGASASLVISGGAVTITHLENDGSAQIEQGNVTLQSSSNNSGGQLVVAGLLNAAGIFDNETGARLELAGGTGRIRGSGTLNNNGLLTGDGTIAKTFTTNSATGEIRVDAGKTLYFTGNFNPNDGELTLQGGTIDIAGSVTNNAGGFISGRGTLRTGGLTNDGQMAFSGGTMDIRGDVTLSSGSRVVTAGAGSVTTFFDDVVHNGTEIFTGAGASTVFFGDQSGAGSFTGTGTVYYIGDLRPGNSPGLVTYAGDVVFGSLATLELQLGGLVPGGQFDRLDVAGSLLLDGILILSLIDGFTPAEGDSFQVFSAGSLKGGFDSVLADTLPAGLAWDTSQLGITGALTVIPEPATVLLLISGLFVLLLRARRKSPIA